MLRGDIDLVSRLNSPILQEFSKFKSRVIAFFISVVGLSQQSNLKLFLRQFEINQRRVSN